MTVEQVREMIYAAFPEKPVPAPGRLVRHSHARDREGEERIRRELAGKRWTSLTPEFLEKRWASFIYLGPEAYRYYLPSLLMGAMAGYKSLDHSVVFSLRPRFGILYSQGDDDILRTRQSVFTDAQYRAVCAFLGCMFDRPSLRHLAAQALRWGWNGIDTDTLKAARAYYRRLHTFSFPDPEDPEAARLCAEIRAAFAAGLYPGDENLGGSTDDEAAEYAMEFRGVKWQSAHPELLACNYAALSFFSAAGFRYFLPAFLLADLLDCESGANPVFHLTHGLYTPAKDWLDIEKLPDEFGTTAFNDFDGIDPGKLRELFQRSEERRNAVDWRAYSVERFASFSREERLAIIHYLEFQATEELDASAIYEALETYWRPSVREAARSFPSLFFEHR